MNEISKMMYNDIRKELEVVWQNARPYVGPKCRACRECNGINCRRIGAERSTTGARNYEKFQQIKSIQTCQNLRLYFRNRQCSNLLHHHLS